MNAMCGPPCSPVSDVDHELKSMVKIEILHRRAIGFQKIVSAVLTVMEPWVHLGDLVRMMITSRNYFNADIEYKTSLYKHWVTESDMVLEDRVVAGWADDAWSDCGADVQGLPERFGCPCSFCCDSPHYREWARLCEQQGHEDLYSVDDIEPPI